MVSKEFLVQSETGFESKTTAMFIQKASKYNSSVWIEKNERKANAKSLLGLLSLGIGKGAKIILTINGDDEKNAMNELTEYICSTWGSCE